jgi:hypothetical protein
VRIAEGSVSVLHESFLYVVWPKVVADPSGKVIPPNAEVARTVTGIFLGTRTSVLPNTVLMRSDRRFGSAAKIDPTSTTPFPKITLYSPSPCESSKNKVCVMT